MKVSNIIWALTAFALMASQMMPVSEACQQLIYLSSRPDNTRRNQTEWKPPTAEKSNHGTIKDIMKKEDLKSSHTPKRFHRRLINP